MPELPEVETVRDGLARHVVGRTVTAVQVHHPRAVRRHVPGAADFAERLAGRTFEAAVRRGKFLWLTIGGDDALTAHLGMSGQLLVHHAVDAPEHPHLRVRMTLTAAAEPDRVLDFVDQRTFGHLGLAELVPTPDGGPGGYGSPLAALPPSVVHIARDLLDPDLDRAAVVAGLRRRHTELKRALLDQTLVSGIGNIYADEALWRARLHGARPTDRLRPGQIAAVLAAAEAVMRAALQVGGTSFDALYVDVNGSSGYFDRELAVYGRAGLPCRRCGAPVVRTAFMNRSSFTCPRCQARPRRGR
ncbi:bifunctional DNA-formamidopyrimidine glycosylase/DNA-(apurinic or apyrimidinic site) lyase [Actinotalea sp. M2MS4P-6]|uniref:bifunctional DNA-formamidopyrimidine glycosylase/DNA-(apurinic or apyrimidinic site) lyase n=1 Tax=Actinotalea sp. M2MS4P-6 TaxID=2983762 RepID=UPI0021E39140|nr:bifunctional DNA-formamidopyrimidine glycosylase/DNA-(apurinic or apyrimidinic site) lyase [Actinotalea sp. M2MS4P-6]MCV2393977.1 bifunctional DNA-formamidopyrimidine glycosylase/DNA-(apurinic or apyrimidinic site) lyase [Actinotalea sp. M2MS4P-6]